MISGEYTGDVGQTLRLLIPCAIPLRHGGWNLPAAVDFGSAPTAGRKVRFLTAATVRAGFDPTWQSHHSIWPYETKVSRPLLGHSH
jgi:hypothetical protein